MRGTNFFLHTMLYRHIRDFVYFVFLIFLTFSKAIIQQSNSIPHSCFVVVCCHNDRNQICIIFSGCCRNTELRQTGRARLQTCRIFVLPDHFVRICKSKLCRTLFRRVRDILHPDIAVIKNLWICMDQLSGH